MTDPFLDLIISELTQAAAHIQTQDLDALAAACADAPRIFVAGAGRSGHMIRAFANRLLHLGKTVFVVGDTTTPPIKENDLLIIGSGSGETASLKAYAAKARNHGARIATVTLNPQATVGRLADIVVTVPGSSPKAAHSTGAQSAQPMGTLFEQLSELVYDAIILRLMDSLSETDEAMFARHANLE